MFYETLELRAMMSADPNVAVNSAVMTDRMQIHADLLKFRADGLAFAATISTDLAKLQADGALSDPTLLPLFKTLQKDVKSMRLMLRGDRMTESESVVKDELKICKDHQQFRHDRGDHAAQKADRVMIRAERIKLQTDEVAGLTARVSTREVSYDKIFADLNAISAAAATDTSASDQMKADIQAFTTDGTTGLQKKASDMHKLIADRTQLITDLTALQPQA